MENKETKYFSPLKAMGEFVIHVFVGAVIFSTIALLAIGMSKFREYLELNNVNELILTGLVSAEYILFAVDLFLFVVFFTSSAISFTKKLLSPHGGSE